jgi:hypothetical protein
MVYTSNGYNNFFNPVEFRFTNDPYIGIVTREEIPHCYLTLNVELLNKCKKTFRLNMFIK